jgi:hypothetical protein
MRGDTERTGSALAREEEKWEEMKGRGGGSGGEKVRSGASRAADRPAL